MSPTPLLVVVWCDMQLNAALVIGRERRNKHLGAGALGKPWGGWSGAGTLVNRAAVVGGLGTGQHVVQRGPGVHNTNGGKGQLHLGCAIPPPTAPAANTAQSLKRDSGRDKSTMEAPRLCFSG